MALIVGEHDTGENTPMSDINTTPLVDVMLVLLIIFLIAVPVVLQTVPVKLPQVRYEPTTTKPENVNLSVKAASDVYCPLDGEIVEVNPAIVADPSLVNSDPQGAGWFFKLKLKNLSDADGLLDEAAYKELTA